MDLEDLEAMVAPVDRAALALLAVRIPAVPVVQAHLAVLADLVDRDTAIAHVHGTAAREDAGITCLMMACHATAGIMALQQCQLEYLEFHKGTRQTT